MSERLRVDWIRCEAHGLCHELLPEVVGLDEWGYPVVAPRVPDDLDHLARRAVAACPSMALRLVQQPPSTGAGTPWDD
jgi:ferredoxin